MMRKTLVEWRARGDRNQLAGFRIIKARRLKGGWYEKRASDLTLRQKSKEELFANEPELTLRLSIW